MTEGSKGEGLSKFLAIQFLIANGYGGAAPPGYDVTAIWLNSSRPDYVNNNPDDATNPILKAVQRFFCSTFTTICTIASIRSSTRVGTHWPMSTGI